MCTYQIYSRLVSSVQTKTVFLNKLLIFYLIHRFILMCQPLEKPTVSFQRELKSFLWLMWPNWFQTKSQDSENQNWDIWLSSTLVHWQHCLGCKVLWCLIGPISRYVQISLNWKIIYKSGVKFRKSQNRRIYFSKDFSPNFCHKGLKWVKSKRIDCVKEPPINKLLCLSLLVSTHFRD